MKNSKTIFRVILGLFVAQFLCLIVPQTIFSQTETLDIVTFTPPVGWAKTIKDGAVVYSDVNTKTGSFCILTVYASTASSGDAQKDFANSWNDLAVKQFKTAPNPKTETQTDPAGWKGTVAAEQGEADGGLQGYALLTVYSGFGKTVSIFAFFNKEEYLARLDAVVEGVKLDKTKALAQTTPPVQNDQGTLSTRDPFPDKPNRGPQEPLAGPLKNSITIADLVGDWSDSGGANVVTYVHSGSGSYAGTDATFSTGWYTIKSDGSFTQKFQGRTDNHTVREVSSGTFTLSGGNIIVNYTGGDRRTSMKYQFVAYMTLPNGGAVLTLIYLGESTPYTGSALIEVCGHAHAFITCGPGEVWVRKPAR